MIGTRLAVRVLTRAGGGPLRSLRMIHFDRPEIRVNHRVQIREEWGNDQWKKGG